MSGLPLMNAALDRMGSGAKCRLRSPEVLGMLHRRLGRKTEFVGDFSATSCKTAGEKIFVSLFQKSCYLLSVPPHRRGVRVVTNVEAGCGGRGELRDDERSLSRTAKPCGPDTPTLVLSLRRR